MKLFVVFLVSLLVASSFSLSFDELKRASKSPSRSPSPSRTASPSRTPSTSPVPSASPAPDPNAIYYYPTDDSYGTRGLSAPGDQCVYNGNQTTLVAAQGGFLGRTIPTWTWIKFATNTISSSTTIQAATIVLTGCGAGAADGRTYDLYSMANDWSEDTITGSSSAAPLNCPVQPTLGSYQDTSSNLGGQLAFDVTSLVQAQITAGQATSVRIQVPGVSEYLSEYCSKDSPNSGSWPILYIIV